MPGVITYHELKQKTVHDLRELAQGLQHEAVQGYTQMNKEHLIAAIAKALHIATHEEHHVEAGYDKSANKARMRALRARRDAALEAHDATELKAIRRELHHLNREIRKHTV
jgi:hypothetical protein